MIYWASFFFPSTIWSVQSHNKTTTGASLPHIMSIFNQGILFIVAMSPSHSNPNTFDFFRILSLFFHTQMWSWHEAICLWCRKRSNIYKKRNVLTLVGKVQSPDFWKFKDTDTDIRHVQTCLFLQRNGQFLMSVKMGSPDMKIRKKTPKIYINKKYI